MPAAAAKGPEERRNWMGAPWPMMMCIGLVTSRMSWCFVTCRCMHSLLRTSRQLVSSLASGSRAKTTSSRVARSAAPRTSAAEKTSQATRGPSATQPWMWPAMNSGGTTCVSVAPPSFFWKVMQIFGTLYSLRRRPLRHLAKDEAPVELTAGASTTVTPARGCALRVHCARSFLSKLRVQSTSSSLPCSPFLTQTWERTDSMVAPASL
mmetsp:Transcript_33943/g.107855  ORF Transcript_33943/g.107855 Transcript_33943/m.107855 type:complete len:208 (-) Transcript_33943:1528-2151(-)